MSCAIIALPPAASSIFATSCIVTTFVRQCTFGAALFINPIFSFTIFSRARLLFMTPLLILPLFVVSFFASSFLNFSPNLFFSLSESLDFSSIIIINFLIFIQYVHHIYSKNSVTPLFLSAVTSTNARILPATVDIRTGTTYTNIPIS